MKKREKVKYGIGSNECYIYRELWNYDKKVIFFGLVEAVFKVLAAYGLILLPAWITGMLERRGSFASMVALIVVIFGGYALVSVASTYLEQRNGMQYIPFRVGYMQWKMESKVSMSLQKCLRRWGEPIKKSVFFGSLWMFPPPCTMGKEYSCRRRN